MKCKTILFSFIFGIFLVATMAGCGHSHNQDGGHSHESVNQDPEKKKKSNHDTID